MNNLRRILLCIIAFSICVLVPVNVFADGTEPSCDNPPGGIYDVILFWGQSQMVGYSGRGYYCGTDNTKDTVFVDSNKSVNGFASKTGIDSAIVNNYKSIGYVSVPVASGKVYDYKYPAGGTAEGLMEVTSETGKVVPFNENGKYQTDNSIGQFLAFDSYDSKGNPILKGGTKMANSSIQMSYGTNLAIWYAKRHYEKTGHKVVIVMAARSGEKLNHFLPYDASGSDTSTTKTNYDWHINDVMITKYKSAINYLDSKCYKIGNTFHVLFQGGADVKDGTSTNDWAAMYETVHNQLKHLDVANKYKPSFGVIIESSYTYGNSNLSGVEKIHAAQEKVIAENDDVILGTDYAYKRYIPDEAHYSGKYLDETMTYTKALNQALLSTCSQCHENNDGTGNPNTVHYNAATLSQIGLETADSVAEYLSDFEFKIGEYVFFDPVNNQACAQSNYWTPYNQNTTCYRWAVIDVDKNNRQLRLLLDHNTDENIPATETLTKLNELKTVKNWDSSLSLSRLGTRKFLTLSRLNASDVISKFKSGQLTSISNKITIGFLYSNNFQYTYNKDANQKNTIDINAGYWITPTSENDELSDGYTYYTDGKSLKKSETTKAKVGLRPTVQYIPFDKVKKVSYLDLNDQKTNNVSIVLNGGSQNFKNLLVNSQADDKKVTKYAAQGMVTHTINGVVEFCMYLTQRLKGNDPYPNDNNEKGMMLCTTDPTGKNEEKTRYEQVLYYHGNDFTYNYMANQYAGTIFGQSDTATPGNFRQSGNIFGLANGTQLTFGRFDNTIVTDQELSYDYDHGHYYVGNKNYKAPILSDNKYYYRMSTSEEGTLTAQGHEYHEGYIYDVQYEAGTFTGPSSCTNCLEESNRCGAYQVYCGADNRFPESTGMIYVYNAKLNQNGKPSRGYGKLARVLYLNFNHLVVESCKFNEFEAVSFADKHSSMMYMNSHAQYDSGNAYPKIYGINLDNVKFSDGRYLYRDYVYYINENTSTVERYHSNDLIDLNYYGNEDNPSYLGWIYSRKGNGQTTTGNDININEKFVKNSASITTPASTDENNVKIYLQTVKLESVKYPDVASSSATLTANGNSISKFLKEFECTNCTPVVVENGTEKTTGEFEVSKTYTLRIKATTTDVVDAGDNILERGIIPETATISYNANGGEGNIDSITYTPADEGTITLSSVEPTRVGYTFKSWNTKIDGSGDSYLPGGAFDKSINGNTTLYAQWEIHKVYIKINVNGGYLSEQHGSTIGIVNDNITVNDSINVHTIKYNGSLGPNGLINYANSEYVNIVKDGYTAPAGQEWTVDGIFYDQAVVYNASDFCDSTNGDCTVELFVNWVPVNYTISYNLAGGSVNNNPTSYNVESNTITLNNPEKQGYTFTGWTGSNGDNPETSVSIVTGSTGNKQYTANYRANQYSIVFNSNGGEGSMDNLAMEYGVAKNIPTNSYTRAGYKFVGWNTSPEGTGDNYSAGESISNLTDQDGDEITFYAMWVQEEVSEYIIRYETNGGINNPSNPTSYTQGSTKTLLSATKKGSTFEGWYKDSNYTTKVEEITSDMAEDLVLYAKWSANTYTITFNSNGGSSVNSITKEYNEEVVRPTDPTKEGYEFIGWYKDEGLTQEYYFDVMPDYDFTLYAKWREVIYDVLFDTVGGTELNPVRVRKNGILGRPSNPEKAGYRFVDWYLNMDYTTTYNFSSPVVSDLILYAKWETDSFTVIFNTVGGTAIEPISVNYNEEIVLPNNPEKRGYTFARWVDENNNEFVSGLMPARDIILTAVWTKNQYTITFDSNGGSEVSAITADYNTRITQPEDPVKNKYKFAGWYSDPELTRVYSFTTMPAENITVYAKWVKKQNVISYELDGGVNNYNNPTSYTSGNEKELYSPSKVGYTFKGWYLDSNFTERITEINSDLEGDITLYAKWQINQYTIVFDSNGGSEVPSITQDYGTEVVEPEEPIREHYKFMGWYNDEALSTIYNFDIMPNMDMTLYAKWHEDEKKSITFETNGGSELNPIIAYVGESISSPSDPVKEGARFAGWYSDPELTSLYSFTVMPEESIIVYAKWVSNDNNIIYYDLSDGVNNQTNPTSFTPGDTIELKEPTRDGYKFLGWYSDPEYTNKVEKITTDMNSDVKLYAKWESLQIVDVENTAKSADVIMVIGLIIIACGTIVFVKQQRKISE